MGGRFSVNFWFLKKYNSAEFEKKHGAFDFFNAIYAKIAFLQKRGQLRPQGTKTLRIYFRSQFRQLSGAMPELAFVQNRARHTGTSTSTLYIPVVHLTHKTLISRPSGHGVFQAVVGDHVVMHG